MTKSLNAHDLFQKLRQRIFVTEKKYYNPWHVMCWQLGKKKQKVSISLQTPKGTFSFFSNNFLLDQAGIAGSYLQNLTFFAHFFALAFFTSIFWINNFTWKFKISRLEKVSSMKRIGDKSRTEPIHILRLPSWNLVYT